jgi:hypothetical protein
MRATGSKLPTAPQGIIKDACPQNEVCVGKQHGAAPTFSLREVFAAELLDNARRHNAIDAARSIPRDLP